MIATTAARASRLPLARTLSTTSLRLPTTRTQPALRFRPFSTSPLRNSTPPTTTTKVEEGKVLATYSGPLASTFTRLKLFSLGSLGLATTLTPILLLAPGEISFAGRVGLCITALATSGVSTALIAWIGTPYVGTARLLSPSNTTSPIMELNTVSWRLKPIKTLVYEPTFLRPTSRPFASWEISNNPPAMEVRDGERVEKKVAESFDVKSGESLGSWWVRYEWEGEGDGKVRGRVEVRGKPTRYFNIHEELLGDEWQVLG